MLQIAMSAERKKAVTLISHISWDDEEKQLAFLNIRLLTYLSKLYVTPFGSYSFASLPVGPMGIW